jgi:hypothetical protein
MRRSRTPEPTRVPVCGAVFRSTDIAQFDVRTFKSASQGYFDVADNAAFRISGSGFSTAAANSALIANMKSLPRVAAPFSASPTAKKE